MNRRNFLNSILKAGLTFTILPPATTYSRIWKATIDPKSIVNPEWITAEYEFSYFDITNVINLDKSIHITKPKFTSKIYKINALR